MTQTPRFKTISTPASDTIPSGDSTQPIPMKVSTKWDPDYTAAPEVVRKINLRSLSQGEPSTFSKGVRKKAQIRLMG